VKSKEEKEQLRKMTLERKKKRKENKKNALKKMEREINEEIENINYNIQHVSEIDHNSEVIEESKMEVENINIETAFNYGDGELLKQVNEQ